MVFAHVNDYYINLDHVHYIRENEEQYMVYFGNGPEGKEHYTVINKRSVSGQNLMQGLLSTARIIG